MNIEEMIYARLVAHPLLTEHVGDRIYPTIREQDAELPCINYQRVSSQRFPAMHSTPQATKAHFTFDIWAADYATAIIVKKRLRMALNRWRTSTGMNIFDAFVVSETDTYEGDPRQHHIAMEVEIDYDA